MKLLIWGVIGFLVLAIGFAGYILFFNGDKDLIKTNETDSLQDSNQDSQIEDDKSPDSPDYSSLLNSISTDTELSQSYKILEKYLSLDNKKDFQTLFLPSNDYIESSQLEIESVLSNDDLIIEFIEKYTFSEKLDIQSILTLKNNQTENLLKEQVSIRISNGALLFNGQLCDLLNLADSDIAAYVIK